MTLALARTFRAAAAAVLLGWTPQALAAPFTYDSYSVLNNQTVQLSDPAEGFNEMGGSGQITLLGGTMPGGALATFCVDIPNLLLNAGGFATLGTIGGDLGRKVNALLTNASQYLATNYDASSALQIAIWKVEYGSELTVTAPNATAALALADSWVGNVSGTNPLWLADPTMQVAVFRANGANQDQAYLTAVPEPASAVLLLGSMAGAGVLRRRRRAFWTVRLLGGEGC